ncbi:hypothetical protein Tco_0015891 [Tanacetum coccineum]
MTTLADKAILSGADNRPPMLEKDMYDSWKNRMELYMMSRQHGRMILESVENGPLIWPSIKENRVTRLKKYSELSATEAIQTDCDVKAINNILQGLPPEERQCKLYDEFDKFAYKKGETILNIKFLNTLPPEWSKFVTDVKLIRDLHTTNIDQLHAYLGQHEFHANEVHLMYERNSDPLALVATHQMTWSPYQSQQYSTHQSSTPLSITYPSNDYQSSIHHNVYSPSSSIPQLEYAPSCTKLKRKWDDSWFKDKVLLVQAQASGQILHDDELAFLADPRISEGQATQTIITHNAAYQANDLDAYDFDCDKLNTAKVALIANLSHYGSNALAKVHNHDNVNNDMINQVVQVMPSSEQSNGMTYSETEITSDSNIIPYSHFGEIEALFIQLTAVSFVFVKSDGVSELLDVNGWNGRGSGESFEEVGVLQDVHNYLEYGIGLSSFHIQETIAFSQWDPFVTRQDLLIRPSRWRSNSNWNLRSIDICISYCNCTNASTKIYIQKGDVSIIDKHRVRHQRTFVHFMGQL